MGLKTKLAPPAPATTDVAADIPVAGADSTAAAGGSAAQGSAVQENKPVEVAKALWTTGTPMKMHLYSVVGDNQIVIGEDKPLVSWDNLTYGNWNDVREADFILDVPEAVTHNNASWYIGIVLEPRDREINAGNLQELPVYKKEVTRWMPKRIVRKEKSLLGGSDEEETEEVEEQLVLSKADRPIVSYWAPNLTVSIVSDTPDISMAQVQPVTREYFQFRRDEEGKLGYAPTIFTNDFWLLKEHLVELNETVSKVPLHVNYKAISMMKFNIFSSLTASFEQSAAQQGSGAELDEVKRMLTETNPILLITTAIVTILHMLFEFLAFSSDVSHWRNKDKNQDLVGVSLRTILTNVFVKLVILLYLHDSSEETSFMILFTEGIGVLIEAWKVTKVVNIRVREDPSSIIGYRITFEDKHELSEDEKKTQEYDKLAFKIVSIGAAPFLVGYAIYSLLYLTHRSWYSYIVTTLAQAVYLGGFIQLVPQLIINYKLKSVAHMPMKAMVYKTLSTVVDDFFAFCVKMPMLHRLACFRDDVVFLILLYQRWIYRVDYSRVNEYGQGGLEEKAVEDKKTDGDKVKDSKTVEVAGASSGVKVTQTKVTKKGGKK
ncbi:cleft lip and palate associated transmembrane protein [Trichosporon asahii var. asahii CBS 8904]|uniref:Cleft lip and palate associated transmembrane protein n=1 Tax=Trichosporon asahii var. asahii (strain CBS 8904) TaxID=1220162 RepID=K1WXF6_TRIAC|nr:cleft lip and palate associated transmembrane protein [Trichosporon asahii var. asahii CBS 8904]